VLEKSYNGHDADARHAMDSVPALNLTRNFSGNAAVLRTAEITVSTRHLDAPNCTSTTVGALPDLMITWTGEDEKIRYTALALWDLRLANYRFPTSICLRI
jgi:hypothetical protein